jgi:hypothetical protein
MSCCQGPNLQLIERGHVQLGLRRIDLLRRPAAPSRERRDVQEQLPQRGCVLSAGDRLKLCQVRLCAPVGWRRGCRRGRAGGRLALARSGRFRPRHGGLRLRGGCLCGAARCPTPRTCGSRSAAGLCAACRRLCTDRAWCCERRRAIWCLAGAGGCCSGRLGGDRRLHWRRLCFTSSRFLCSCAGGSSGTLSAVRRRRRAQECRRRSGVARRSEPRQAYHAAVQGNLVHLEVAVPAGRICMVSKALLACRHGYSECWQSMPVHNCTAESLAETNLCFRMAVKPGAVPAYSVMPTSSSH